MLIVGELIHEGEEEGDEVTIPDVQVDVLILFGLKERDLVDFDLPECGAVEGMQCAMRMTTEFVVDTCKELRDLPLGNGRCEVNIPGRQTGEGV